MDAINEPSVIVRILAHPDVPIHFPPCSPVPHLDLLQSLDR
jgi:hypothetical protein